MTLIRQNITTDIRGLDAGCIFKRDRSGLHIISAASKEKGHSTTTQTSRQAAFRKCIDFIQHNYNDTFRSLWERFNSNKLQWNQKFISFNINRLIENKPIIRYPPEVNLLVNGNFDAGISPWLFSTGFTLDNYRAHFHYDHSSNIQQPILQWLEKGRPYNITYEIESIYNVQVVSILLSAPPVYHTTKGYVHDIVTPTLSGYTTFSIAVYPTSGTGDVVISNIGIN